MANRSAVDFDGVTPIYTTETGTRFNLGLEESIQTSAAVTYPQLERNTRGVTRGVAMGTR